MKEKIVIDRSKSAVVIMDYQMRQVGLFSEEFQNDLLQRARAVLTEARRKGIPVVYVEVVRGERTPERGIHPSVTPEPGEVVLTKSRTGPFTTTNLDEVLKEQGVETMVLLGISTSRCVLSTVRCAADLDYKMIVLSDCCADEDDDLQCILMEKVFPRQASVVTSGQFIEALAHV